MKNKNLALTANEFIELTLKPGWSHCSGFGLHDTQKKETDDADCGKLIDIKISGEIWRRSELDDIIIVYSKKFKANINYFGEPCSFNMEDENSWEYTGVYFITESGAPDIFTDEDLIPEDFSVIRKDLVKYNVKIKKK